MAGALERRRRDRRDVTAGAAGRYRPDLAGPADVLLGAAGDAEAEQQPARASRRPEVDHIPDRCRGRARSRSRKCARPGGGGRSARAVSRCGYRSGADGRLAEAARRLGDEVAADAEALAAKLPTVVGHMQTKPFSQWWSFASLFGPVSPSSQSSFDSQLAVQSGPVLPHVAASRRRAAGRCGSGTRAPATRSSRPSRWCRPSAWCRARTCGRCACPRRPRPAPNIARASASSAKLRAVGEIEESGEGNLMGTPWQVRGDLARALARTANRLTKARKAAPCYLHDRSCQASPEALKRARR